MTTIAMNILKSLMTEWLMKRMVYIGLKALASSTKNELDDEAVKTIGQALGLEEKED
jgi:hypothetical protein